MTDKAKAIGGKVVVITGGARGIGLATALALHGLGAKVAIGDIDETAVKQSGTDHDFAFYGRLDVTNQESFGTFLDDVEREVGPIDVLINNAGIMPIGKLVDEPDAVTRRILDINVYGVILGSKLASQRMVPRGKGHVINIASLAGESYTAGLATYCASKYAVVGFTDSARVENRNTGVKFSAVLPSFVNTELTAGTTGLKGIKNAEPEDIAKAIVDLIVHPKSKVRVTWLLGTIVGVQKFLPESVTEAAARLLGAEHVFTDAVDTTKRKQYEDRARGAQ